jgi:NAD(P)-dependent dehydrogenase (short-subunit alcohol dehydrogenase family)
MSTDTMKSMAYVEPRCGSLDREEYSTAKVWLITCHCRALVQALAEAVLASGHNLVATTLDPEPLEPLVERYRDQLCIVPVEVTDESAAEAAVKAALGAFGKLDVLVLDLAKWRGGLSYRPLQSSMALQDLTAPRGAGDSSPRAAR